MKKPLGFLLLLVFLMQGCSRSGDDYSRDPARADPKVAAWQQSQGIMTSADYYHLNQLQLASNHGEGLADSDITWCISLMHKHSTHQDAVQAYVMDLFYDDKNMSQSQKQLVRPAVEPYLISQSSLARGAATLAMKRLR